MAKTLNILFDKTLNILFDRIENIVGKGEMCGKVLTI